MQALARAGRARPPMAVRRSRPRSTTPVQPERPWWRLSPPIEVQQHQVWRSALPTRAFSGPSILRLQDTARRAHDQPPANEHPAYLAKYTELSAAISGTPNGPPRSSRPRSSSRRPNCIP